VLLPIERAVATIRSSDPGEMPCHSVGTWPGTPIAFRQGARVIEDSRRLRVVYKMRCPLS